MTTLHVNAVAADGEGADQVENRRLRLPHRLAVNGADFASALDPFWAGRAAGKQRNKSENGESQHILYLLRSLGIPWR